MKKSVLVILILAIVMMATVTAFAETTDRDPMSLPIDGTDWVEVSIEELKAQVSEELGYTPVFRCWFDENCNGLFEVFFPEGICSLKLFYTFDPQTLNSGAYWMSGEQVYTLLNGGLKNQVSPVKGQWVYVRPDPEDSYCWLSGVGEIVQDTNGNYYLIVGGETVEGIFSLDNVREIPGGLLLDGGEIAQAKYDSWASHNIGEFGEDGNPQQQTRVAELYASKGSELPGAAIDARCARITLWGIGVETDMTEGSQTTRSALNRRNPSITEVAGSISRMAFFRM
jgi:hypothetical protein